MKSFLIALVLILGAATAAAQDRIRLSATYDTAEVPSRVAQLAQVDGVNGATGEVDVQLFKTGGFRGSLAYNGRYRSGVEVYPDYFDGMTTMDLYRNVITHSGGVQVEYVIKNRVGPFVGLFYGTEKIHRDAARQVVRDVKVGLVVPFTKDSHVFIKGYLDFRQPFGDPMGGFVNPRTRTFSIGGGFRF
jgi:hypothetical protein